MSLPGIDGVAVALELGNRRPISLVAAGGRLCVVTGDGRILFVRL